MIHDLIMKKCNFSREEGKKRVRAGVEKKRGGTERVDQYEGLTKFQINTAEKITFKVIRGQTDQPTDRLTNRRMDEVSYKGARLHLNKGIA
jgi:hypothetical protein